MAPNTIMSDPSSVMVSTKFTPNGQCQKQEDLDFDPSNSWINCMQLAIAVRTCFWGKGEEQEKAKEESFELLKTLEKQLEGKKFFGGDKIGVVDIVANFVGYWLGILEQVMGTELLTKDKFPKLSEWMDDFVGCNTIKQCLPPRDILLENFRARFGNAS